MTINQINDRLAEIRTAIESPDADIDALEREANDLISRRGELNAEAERRSAILARIANNPSIEGRMPPAADPFFPATSTPMGEVRGAYDAPEYRSAFFHSLMGAPLSAAEKRALSSADDSAGAAIPTQTQNEIMRKMVKLAPMMDEITMLHIPGNITFAIEDSVQDASAHAENAEATDAADKLVSISLAGYEVIKIMSISAKVRAMSISAFEAWLTDTLSEGIARKLEDWIINGSGGTVPQGIDHAQTWTDGTTAVAFAAATPTYAEICEMISLLPAAYDPNAKFLMNKKTFWQKVQAIRDDAKAPIVRDDMNGKYFILGYPVLISDKCADGDLFLGDYKKIVGNFAEDIRINSSDQSGFRRNAVDYRGTCIFDCKVAIGAAIVKGAATL
jgi:HK97 family phage major capsid protein